MFHLKNNKKYKTLYKKFLVSRIDVKNSPKIFKFKKEKWKLFLEILKRKKKIKMKLKPFTNYDYIVVKFASQGNSFQKKFKNDLIAKKTFNYFYGSLMKRYLKKRMNTLYKSKENSHYKFARLRFFESKLDSILYRSKFCFSIKNAQHFISHRHVLVNNKIEKNKLYILKPGDFVRMKTSSFNIVKFNIKKIIQENIRLRKHKRRVPFRKLKNLTKFFNLLWPIPPKYLIINYKTLEIIFDNIKSFNFSVYFPFKLNLHSVIVNYYRH